MNTTALQHAFRVLALCALAGSAMAAAPGESIVLDPGSGNYIITYCGSDSPNSCVLMNSTYEPATKVDPRVRSRFTLTSTWSVNYAYAVRNGAKAKQPLVTLILDPVTSIASAMPIALRSTARADQLATMLANGQAALGSPSDWGGIELPSTLGSGIRVGWSARAGLVPGTRQLGFGYSSIDLPGLITARVTGQPVISPGFVDEGPDGDIALQLETLQTKEYVPRYAAVPSIIVSNPFNRAALLSSIEQQVRGWVSLGQLQASLFAQLDPYLQAAITAAAAGNATGSTSNTAAVRVQLRKVYSALDEALDDWTVVSDSPLISRLAARVLDFDLAFAATHP